MSDEFEIAGLASVGALSKSAPVDEAREAANQNSCANCGADVRGRYCPACGQLNSDFHRPIWTLVSDVMADAFSFDGRIARTIPALMFRPGRVTRAYLEGQRARYVPPFRLFLLASLLFFFALFSMGSRLGLGDNIYYMPDSDGGFSVTIGTPEIIQEMGNDGSEELTPELLREILEREIDRDDSTDMDERLIDEAVRIYENQQLLFMGIERWAPRLSFLILPLMTLFLTVMYLWYRRIYVYDHVILSLHFQSFAYLLGAANIFLGQFVGGGVAWSLFLIPIYLYRQIRETYKSGRIITGIRVLALLILLALCLILVSAGASFLGYRDLG